MVFPADSLYCVIPSPQVPLVLSFYNITEHENSLTLLQADDGYYQVDKNVENDFYHKFNLMITDLRSYTSILNVPFTRFYTVREHLLVYTIHASVLKYCEL